MTDRLPPNLLRLFQPRPAIEYLSPIDRDPSDRLGNKYTGVASFIELLKDHDPDYQPWETAEEKRQRKKEEREVKAKLNVEKGLEEWKPQEDPNATGDPFKTLFVGRLSYSSTEKSLKKEFEFYGPLKEIKIVKDKDGKPRGYAFLEFEREKDMKAAFKDADGIKLDGKRIVVDVERGRTVKGWRPRRLGGGLGHTRKGPKELNQNYPGRENAQRMASSLNSSSSYSDSYSKRRDDYRGGPPRRSGYGGGDRYENRYGGGGGGDRYRDGGRDGPGSREATSTSSRDKYGGGGYRDNRSSFNDRDNYRDRDRDHGSRSYGGSDYRRRSRSPGARRDGRRY